MDILKKLGFGTMRLPVDENEDINYELIGQEKKVNIQCKFYNVTRHCRILRSIKSVWHRDNNGMQKNS